MKFKKITNLIPLGAVGKAFSYCKNHPEILTGASYVVANVFRVMSGYENMNEWRMGYSATLGLLNVMLAVDGITNFSNKIQNLDLRKTSIIGKIIASSAAGVASFSDASGNFRPFEMVLGLWGISGQGFVLERLYGKKERKDKGDKIIKDTIGGMKDFTDKISSKINEENDLGKLGINIFNNISKRLEKMGGANGLNYDKLCNNMTTLLLGSIPAISLMDAVQSKDIFMGVSVAFVMSGVYFTRQMKSRNVVPNVNNDQTRGI